MIIAAAIEIMIADSQLKVAVSKGHSEIFETLCSKIWMANKSAAWVGLSPPDSRVFAT